jgi:hypothetical protein
VAPIERRPSPARQDRTGLARNQICLRQSPFGPGRTISMTCEAVSPGENSQDNSRLTAISRDAADPPAPARFSCDVPVSDALAASLVFRFSALSRAHGRRVG